MALRSESYPFLAIARAHGLDYGDVLERADVERKWTKTTRGTSEAYFFSGTLDHWERRSLRITSVSAVGEICEAVAHHERVGRGEKS